MAASNAQTSDAAGAIHGRAALSYAKALLGAADSAGAVDAVAEELDSLLDDVFAASDEAKRALTSPWVLHEDRVRLIDRLFAGQATQTFVNFLKVLSEKERLELLPTIRTQLHELLNERAGKIAVEVESAAPLDAESRARLLATLQRCLGGEPVLSERVRPELVGGVVFRVGDTVFDGSVATRLQRLKSRMIDRSIHEIQSGRNRFSSPAGD